MFPMQDSCPPITPLCSLPIRRPQVEKAAEAGGTTKAVQSHFERKASRQQTSRSHHTKVVYFIFKSAITGKKSQILKGKQKPNTGFCIKPSTGEAGSGNICSCRHIVFSLTQNDDQVALLPEPGCSDTEIPSPGPTTIDTSWESARVWPLMQKE